MRKNIFLLIVFSFFIGNLIYAQENVPVTKTTVIKSINGKDYYMHKVEKGQTLYSISKVYNVPIDDIIYENPDAKSGIIINQILKIPLVSRESEISKTLSRKDFEFFYHVAKRGERFKDVADIYMVSVNNLKMANPDVVEPMKEGEYVKIPVIIKESKPVKTYEKPKIKPQKPPVSDQKPQDISDDEYINHIVKKGENLYRIALTYKISIDSLKIINPGLSEKLKIGQIIKIPKKKSDKGFISHTIQKRSNVNRSAKKYDLDVMKILEINPLIDYKLRKGQILKIPVEEIILDSEALSDTLPGDFIKKEKLLNIDSIRCNEAFKNIEKTYNVALMLPFYLEEADSLIIEEPFEIDDILSAKSFNFIQFYEGFMLAVDSLKESGLKLRLFVYDVDQNITKTIKVLQQPELSTMDLIIGPLYSKSFALASNFAKIFNINIVNPLSSRNEILYNNPHVYKVNPSLNAQVEQVAEFIKEYYPDAKIIFARHNKYRGSKEINRFEKALKNVMNENVLIPNALLYNILIECSENDTALVVGELMENVQVEENVIFRDQLENSLDDSTRFRNYITEVIYDRDSIYGVINNASIARENIILTFTNDKVFVLDFLTKLKVLRDTFDIKVIGLPVWDKFNDIEAGLFINLKLHVFSPTYINYYEDITKIFVLEFRSKYRTEPQQYAFEGFDIAFYFLSALMKFGKDFDNCLPYFYPGLLHTKLNFERNSPNNGYENTYWNIYKYEDYKQKKLPNPAFN